MHWPQRFLVAMAAVPLLTLAIIAAWPPPTSSYRYDLVLLLVIALAALWLSRTTVTVAIFLYCTFALFPVGAMIAHYHAAVNGWSALVLIPLAGIVIVAILTKDNRATLFYGFIAFVANLVTGAIYNDVGQAGALAFLSVLVTLCAILWLDCDVQKAHAKLDETCQQLDEQRGELRAVKKQMQQELLHDPPGRQARP